MYETEINSRVETTHQIPASVLERFTEFREDVIAKTVLPWGEHCTECVWPSCYRTCDLYDPREDGRCRRFVDGMVRLDCPGAVNSYLLKVRFKRWGKLWSPGNIRLSPIEEADRLEEADFKIGSGIRRLAVPAALRTLATSKRYSWKKRKAVKAKPSETAPDLFVIECYNPGEHPISLTFSIRPEGGLKAIAYEQLILVTPGFHRELILAQHIERLVDLRSPFGLDLTPNDISDGTPLVFGLLDFVKSKTAPIPKVKPSPTVKCVVWDLDNTLWSGVLVEDGAEKLVLKPRIREVIQELDRRGILNSIASKNNFDDALEILRANTLDEYFLYPQISWGRKSNAIETIAKKLNIGADTLLFIDDSPFELAQVQSACPGVQVLPADHYEELLGLPACQAPVTEESASRRKLYQQEAVRAYAAEEFAGEYLAFLRDCKIELRISKLSRANLERVHELAQRTNQMNFSGNRYERRTLMEVADASHLDTYVIDCRDRFGSYGIIGFSIVDSREPRMIDLMFSCRVQAKRVEHAVLTYLIRRYTSDGAVFFANFRKTARNAPSGRVFDDFGMEVEAENEGLTSLRFPPGRKVPDDGIVSVTVADEVTATAEAGRAS